MNALKRYTKTLLFSAGCLAAALLAGCGGGGDQGRDPILGLPSATLSSVTVTPATATVAIGAAQQFVASANFADGSSRDVTASSSWTSAAAGTASINSGTGLATGVAAGATTLSAVYQGKTGSAALTVSAATLRSIAVTPALPSLATGATLPLVASGTFSDGSIRDITAIATFASASPAIASVTAHGGVATGVSAGATLISASSGGLQGSTTLTVTPVVLLSLALTPQNPVVEIGAIRQLTLTATYSDQTIANVSASAVFSSATPAAATVGAATGLSTGIAAGSSVISASFGGKQASTTVTVPAAVLSSIAVTPATASIAAGASQRFIATATYSDNSHADISASVNWTSSNNAIANILPGGVAGGLSAGSVTISATSGGKSGTALLNVTVTAPVTLSSISVTPATATITAGASQRFVATATYSDNSHADISNSVSWTSSNTSVATIVPGGLASGVAAGASTISATSGGSSASATLSVTATAPVTFESISITPANASVLVGATQQFVVTAHYSDGSTAAVSATTVNWSLGNNTVASISIGGNATALVAGTVSVTASANGKSASATLTVTDVVPPAPATINLGSAANFGVLAGTSITNNSGGTTLVTGDVGAASQTTPPTQVAGYHNYTSGDAELSQGLADLQVAITSANGRTCDVSSASGIDLGGLTLPPGVYCYAGAISITGTFTMSGPGLYIFRTASTLNSTANSIVALSGGATAANLFWVPTGPTTLGANSVFKGSILGQSAAITMGDNATLQNGRVLSGAAITLRNNVISK